MNSNAHLRLYCSSHKKKLLNYIDPMKFLLAADMLLACCRRANRYTMGWKIF